MTAYRGGCSDTVLMDDASGLFPSATYFVEQAVVGGCLLEPRRVREVAGFLHERHFEDAHWGMAYQRIVDAVRQDRVIDGLLISDDIAHGWGSRPATPHAATSGNPTYWRGIYSMLAEAVVSGSPALVVQYAVRVRREWLRRQLNLLLEAVADEVDTSPTPDAVLDSLVAKAQDLARDYQRCGVTA